MCKITKMVALGAQNSFKVGFFRLISYIRNTGENMQIEKIITFLSLKTVVIFGYFFAIFDSFRQTHLIFDVFELFELLRGLKNVFYSLLYVKISKKGEFLILAGQYALFSILCAAPTF
jgi:hypothetical protein